MTPACPTTQVGAPLRGNTPIPPGQTGLVMVETELLAHEARGTFTLKSWDENGGRPVALGSVTFP